MGMYNRTVPGSSLPWRDGHGYKIVFTFYGLGFPSPHLDMPGLGQGFKGYSLWVLLTIPQPGQAGIEY